MRPRTKRAASDFELAEAKLHAQIERACARESKPELAIRAAIVAALKFLARDEARARLLLVDPISGDCPELERYILMRAQFAAKLRRRRGRFRLQPPHLETIEDAQVGRFCEKAAALVQKSRTAELVDLAPGLIESTLQADLGSKRARELGGAARPPDRLVRA